MRVTIPSHVIFEKLGDQMFLLNLNSGTYFELNPTAARVWTLVQADTDTEQIIETIIDEFNAEPDVVRGDVERLVKDLKDRGLISPSASE